MPAKAAAKLAAAPGGPRLAALREPPPPLPAPPPPAAPPPGCAPAASRTAPAAVPPTAAPPAATPPAALAPALAVPAAEAEVEGGTAAGGGRAKPRGDRVVAKEGFAAPAQPCGAGRTAGRAAFCTHLGHFHSPSGTALKCTQPG